MRALKTDDGNGTFVNFEMDSLKLVVRDARKASILYTSGIASCVGFGFLFYDKDDRLTHFGLVHSRSMHQNGDAVKNAVDASTIDKIIGSVEKIELIQYINSNVSSSHDDLEKFTEHLKKKKNNIVINKTCINGSSVNFAVWSDGVIDTTDVKKLINNETQLSEYCKNLYTYLANLNALIIRPYLRIASNVNIYTNENKAEGICNLTLAKKTLKKKAKCNASIESYYRLEYLYNTFSKDPNAITADDFKLIKNEINQIKKQSKDGKLTKLLDRFNFCEIEYEKFVKKSGKLELVDNKKSDTINKKTGDSKNWLSYIKGKIQIRINQLTAEKGKNGCGLFKGRKDQKIVGLNKLQQSLDNQETAETVKDKIELAIKDNSLTIGRGTSRTKHLLNDCLSILSGIEQPQATPDTNNTPVTKG